MKFLRNLLASILGFFIAIFIFFIFAVGIGAALSTDTNENKEISSNSVLELDLSKPIKDYAPTSDNPWGKIAGLGNEKLALNKIINALENAKTDNKIKGISIKTTTVNSGIAQTQAIRDKIKDFKESGKFVYAYNDFYLQKNYYLSSVADSVFLNPIGSVDFKGLATEILYYKDFEDKYGVKMEVIRHGKYKSAVEPYLQNKMSEANREQTTSFLNSIWSKMLADMSASRNISIEKLNNIADNANGRNAKLALENNLIDNSIYEDQYTKKLEIAAKTKKVKTISIGDYIKSGKGFILKTNKNKIAVIYAQGTIKYEKGDEEVIGQKLMKKAIRKAVKNKNVKAIVLRVNSPGGSALVSDIIWRELELAKKEKPLVVSMGNVAASGGYYISCNADRIFAQPTTITGSIGVFGAIPNAHELSKRIGINAEQVSTNKHPNYSLFEPMDKRFYDVTKEGVEQTYNIFINRVAKGRKMTPEQVNEIAQGRVWSGKEALANGLVDELGSLDDAVAYAAKIAKIENYKVKNYPKYEKDFEETFKSLSFVKASRERVLKDALGDESYQLYNKINEIKSFKGIQARMPYVLEIK